VSHEAAERAVQATLQTPNERLSRGGGEAVAHLAASLPQSFEPLVTEAQHRYLDIMPAGEF
jgi:uncharacterized protein (DUF2267 family)